MDAPQIETLCYEYISLKGPALSIAHHSSLTKPLGCTQPLVSQEQYRAYSGGCQHPLYRNMGVCLGTPLCPASLDGVFPSCLNTASIMRL